MVVTLCSWEHDKIFMTIFFYKCCCQTEEDTADNQQFLASFVTIFLLATGLSLITVTSIGSADFLPLITLQLFVSSFIQCYH